MDNKDALVRLQNVVANHQDYQQFAAGLKSSIPDQVQQTLIKIVIQSSDLGHESILTLAYDAGGNLETRNVFDTTSAVFYEPMDCIKFLTEHGFGMTPTDSVVNYQPMDCIKFLAEQGVDQT